MKYFIAIVLIASVASAALTKPTVVTDEMAQIAEIVAAIQSPSTDPATAVALEQMLYEVLGVPHPSIIDAPQAIAVGPAIVDNAPVEETPVAPAIVPEAPSSSNPLVQIILNINQAAPADVASVAPVDPAPVLVNPVVPDVVSVVDAVPEAVSVVDAVPEAVAVIDFVPEVVSVVDAPASVNPVIITQPAVPSPAVNLPQILN